MSQKKQRDNYTYLTSGPVHRVIITMALPTIVSILVTTPYNIADTSSVFAIREMAETLAHQAGKKVVFAIPEDAEKKVFTKISYAVFATDKLEALGWKPLAGDWQQKLQTTIREEMEKAN